MLIYEKNERLYGTLGKTPKATDKELTYLDENGQELVLLSKDFYFDNKKGGIIRKSDNKVVNVFIDGFKVIPNPTNFPEMPKVKKHSDYLYEIDIKNIDYEYAKEYFKTTPTENLGACTSVWKDGKLYRNFDWNYNYDVAFKFAIPSLESEEFIHGRRFASLNTADSIPGLTKEYVESGEYSIGYKLIPFFATDGVNEFGVGVSKNVVPMQRGDNAKTIPEIEEKYEIDARYVLRFVLDNFESATEAVEYLKNYVSIRQNKDLKTHEYELHYIICDKTCVYILEIIDNKLICKKTDETFKPIIANFHVLRDISGATIDFDNGHVYTPITAIDGKFPTAQGITTHAAGLERYNLIVDNYEDLSNFRDLVLYNNAYLESINPQWYSEFVGKYTEDYELTVDDLPIKFEEYVMPFIREQYKNRSREIGDTWHTTHTSIYDLNTQELSFYDSSEDNKEYKFKLR